MVKNVGFGIIGAGGISQCHAQALQTIEGAELIGFFDLNMAAAARVAEKYGVRAYATLEEMLSDPAIEAVTVATPSGVHCESVEAAARAGKHVMCEKPLDITLERTDRMIRACAENHVLLSSVFQLRYSPEVLRLKQAVTSGRFGKMVLASIQMRWFRDKDYYSVGWRGKKSLDGGGALMNQGIHLVDLLLFLNGDLAEVSAYAGTLTHDIEVEDTLCASLRFRNGSFGTLEVSTSCAPGSPRRLELSGENGSAGLAEDELSHWDFIENAPGDAELRQLIAGRPLPEMANAVPSFTGHARQLANLVGAIRRGEPLEIDGLEARRTVEAICGIYQSAETGKPYVFPER